MLDKAPMSAPSRRFVTLVVAALAGSFADACRTPPQAPLIPAELALSPLAAPSASDLEPLPPVPTASTLGRWWVVESVTRADELSAPGVLWRFREDELSVVKLPSACERQRTDLRAAGDARWKGEEPYPYEAHRDGARLVVVSPTPTPVTITLRAATRDEAAAADDALAHHATLVDTCARAQRCLDDAGPMLGKVVDARAEIGDASSMVRCERTMLGVVVLLERMKKAVPRACETVANR
jgi:hypothetical protein